MTSDVFGYGAAVWPRFHGPRHAGRWPAGAAGVVTARAGTPAARSVLQLQLQVDGPRIAAARFQAYGCPVAIAVGEWLAEQLAGAPFDRLSALTAADIRKALEITEDKAHCALMGEDVLRALARAVRNPS